MKWKNIARLRATGGRAEKMLCCGRRKETGKSVPDITASPGRVPPGPMPLNQQGLINKNGVNDPVLLQGDFRKVSGISSDIFRQIESVENDHDASTAAALETVERRGEMIVRILEIRNIGGRQSIEAAQKFLLKGDAKHTVQLIEIVKRPGQTLGLYIREGNGQDRTDGVFISRIALESAVYNSGCLRVGDEILAVNLVDVTKMSLDDVVIIMSIPRRLLLAIRQRRGGKNIDSPALSSLSRQEIKPPPVVVIKRDIRDDEIDEMERISSRPSKERRTGDGREMTESRSRLGLGLTNYSPQSEQLESFYNRSIGQNDTPTWSYKPPAPPPSVITEQPKGNHFQNSYYANRGTLESLAEKVHPFYAGTSRRLSGSNVPISQSHSRFPRSGSDQHLPRSEYIDYPTLNRHAVLRSGLKSAQPTIGGTLGRYGRYEPIRQPKFVASGTSSLTRRSKTALDYSSDTEATIGSNTNMYYYNRCSQSPSNRPGLSLGPADLSKFNSLPRDKPVARLGLRNRLNERITDENDGNLSAPEYSLSLRKDRNNKQSLQGLAKLLNDPNLIDLRSKLTSSPLFTADEYRAWLRRAPSSSAICDQMRLSRDLLNQQRAFRFSCSAENIHDAVKNTDHLYTHRAALTNTLDRHSFVSQGGISPVPVRSLSSQHIGTANSIRSPSVRRIRQLLELNSTPTNNPTISANHQSPAPTPSTTLPRHYQRQIDINPAEFSKYKLERPVVEAVGVSGMLWIHLLAGRGLRALPENTTQSQTRDLYCVLECDRIHKARTVVRSGDLQFDWDEAFELDLVSNKQLDVLVYSWDPQHRHKLCYRGAISIATILKQAPVHQLALKVEPRGTIYIRIRHTDPVQLYRRRGIPSLRGPLLSTLFGVDLESIVTREAKGAPGSAPVPIILRRCIEEVERRGLDIIGLYRLCGSATKKRLLREAFERNSRTVELSPEHVPDINVITGVIKDYIRELPEPLFTKCLFQMTVNALGVCLPDDPDGNAKLMLSILDYLPRANRATLVFLLDHLSLVVSASERNKMSAQALATALGPPLMLHSVGMQVTDEVDHSQPIAVLKYLLQIWPQPQQTQVSGRRGETVEMRGSKVNVLQAAKSQQSKNIFRTPVVSNLLISDQFQRLAIHNNHPYQLAVDQLARSPQISQVRVKPHQALEALQGSEGRVQLQQQQPNIPSLSSSSSSESSESGAEIIKAASCHSINSQSGIKSHTSISLVNNDIKEKATLSLKDIEKISDKNTQLLSQFSKKSRLDEQNTYAPLTSMSTQSKTSHQSPNVCENVDNFNSSQKTIEINNIPSSKLEKIPVIDKSTIDNRNTTPRSSQICSADCSGSKNEESSVCTDNYLFKKSYENPLQDSEFHNVDYGSLNLDKKIGINSINVEVSTNIGNKIKSNTERESLKKIFVTSPNNQVKFSHSSNKITMTSDSSQGSSKYDTTDAYYTHSKIHSHPNDLINNSINSENKESKPMSNVAYSSTNPFLNPFLLDEAK